MFEGAAGAGQGINLMQYFTSCNKEQLLKFVVSVAVWAALSLAMSSPVKAQIKVDPNAAPHNAAHNTPEVNNASNGVPVVDIARPNAGNLSRNVFTEYNVNSQGIVLNNSTVDGTSQLAGQLSANSKFDGKSADKILVEVTGANRSQLMGDTEIFGAPAHFILSNAYGITCNGCGFINVPDRGLLTTGRPVFDDTTGAFLGVDVHTRDENGDLIRDENGNLPSVDIETGGANLGEMKFFDIVARSIKLNGKINGPNSELGLFSGINRFNYDARTVTKRGEDDEGKPEFGIDSTALGGAYANKITLIGTEAGVGIRTPKEMKAAYGGIHISADGRIVLGKATSQGKIVAKSVSSNIQVEDTVYAETALELTAENGQLSLLEKAAATSKGNVTINAVSVDLASEALLGAGLDENGSLVDGGLLTIQAAQLDNRGGIRSGQDIDIDVTGDINNHGEIFSGRTLALLSGGTLDNNSGATITAGQNIQIASLNLFNSSIIRSDQGAVVASVSDSITNSGEITANTDVALRDFSSLDNAGTISGSTLELLSGGSVTNSGVLNGAATAELGADTISNSGEITAGQSVLVNARNVDNSGSITSGDQLVANISGDLQNLSTGQISADGELVLSGGVHIRNDGLITSGADLVLNASDLENNSTIESRSGSVRGAVNGNVTNSGQLTAAQDLDITGIDQLINSQSGNISAGQSLLVQAGTLDNSGSLSAGGQLTANISGDLTNRATGQLNADGELTLSGGVRVTNDGAITSGGDLVLAAGSLNNRSTIESRGGSIRGSVSGNLDNSGAITAAQDFNVTGVSQAVNSVNSTITAGRDLSIGANTLDNRGSLSAGGQLTANISGDLTNRATGQLNADGELTLSGGVRVTNDGAITSGGDLVLAAGSLNNRSTIESRGGSIRGSVSGNFDNSGAITAAQDFNVAGIDQATNSIEAVLSAGENLTLAANRFVNDGELTDPDQRGQVSARNIAITVDELDNFGDIIAVDGVDIDARLNVYNTLARIEGGGAVRVTAGDLIENIGGTIQGGTTDLNARIVRNIDVVRRNGELILPDNVLKRLSDRADKLIDEAVNDYRKTVTEIDDKVVDALREQLQDDSVEFLKKLKLDDLKDRKKVEDAIKKTLKDRVKKTQEKTAAINNTSKEIRFFGRSFGVSKEKSASGSSGYNREAKGSFFGKKDKETKTETAKAEEKPLSIFDRVKQEQKKGAPEKQKKGFFGLVKKTTTSKNFEDELASKATISATKDLSITTTGDLETEGGKLAAGGNIQLDVGGDVDINAVALEQVKNRKIKGGHDNLSTIKHQLSELEAGGRIKITGKNNAIFNGAKIKAGGSVDIDADGQIVLAGVTDEYHKDYYRKKKSTFGFKKKVSKDKQDDETTIKTTIDAGGMVDIVSNKKDVLVAGTEIKAQNSIRLKAAEGNVTVSAVIDNKYRDKYSKKSSFWGLNSKSKRDVTDIDEIKSSFVSAKGDLIMDSAKGDLIVNGSVLETEGDFYAKADNIVFLSAEEIKRRLQEERKSGLFAEAGKGSFTVGFRKEKHTYEDFELINHASQITAGGSIFLDATNDIISQAAKIQASNSVSVRAGGDVKFLAVQDIEKHSEKHSVKQIGLTVSVQENVSSAISSLKQAKEDFNRGAGSKANEAITKASSVLRAADAIYGLATGPLVSVGASLGVSSNKSKFHQSASIVQVGLVTAGVDIDIKTGQDFVAQGTQVAAVHSLSLDVGRNIDISSGVTTVKQGSQTRNRSAGVGVNVGLGFSGLSVSGNVNASFLNEDMKSTAKQHTLASLTASNVTIKSGKDTTIVGGVVHGHNVHTEVGGNLHVESVQDTYKLKSKTIGGGLSLSAGLGSASYGDLKGPNAGAAVRSAFSNAGNTLSQLAGPSGHEVGKSFGVNFQLGKGYADVAWVNEISGIFAENRLTGDVEGNTHLKGAAIVSFANNINFTTNTFTYEDIQDRDIQKNWQVSGGLSFSFDGMKADGPASKSGGWDTQNFKHNKDINTSLPTIDGFYEKTDKRQITRATFGEGSLNIRDKAKQAELEQSGKTKKLASLNRNLDNAQEITKDERDYVGVYVSDTSVKAVGAAVEYIYEQVRRGLISGDKAKEAEEFVRRLKDKEIAESSLGPCNVGQRHGWLHNLLFSPAYAAKGDDCILLTKGRDGLYKDNGERISEEAHKAARMGVISAAMAGMKDAAYGIIALEAKGTLTESEQLQLAAYKTDLQFHMNRYELCWDNSFASAFGGIRSMNDFMAREGLKVNEQYYHNAVDFANGGAEFTERMKSFADLKAPEVQQLQNSNPRLYAALMSVENRQGIENIVDVAFQLNGLAIDGNIPAEQRRHTINHIVQQIKSFDHIGSQDYGRTMRANAVVATQANAILHAIEGLPADTKGHFLNALVGEDLLWQQHTGKELEYQKQLLRAEGELIRRSSEKYARFHGWCDGSRCSDAVLEKARGDLMAQYLKQTSVIWNRELKEGYEYNGSASQFLANTAFNIGKLNTNTYNLEERLNVIQAFDENFQYGRSLFTATDLEKKYNHVLNAHSTYENRDLYNSMESPASYGLHHDWSYTSYANALNGNDFKILSKAGVLELFASASYEAGLQSKFYWDNRKAGKPDTQETDYHRSRSGNILRFIQERVTSARRNGQLKYSEISLYSYYGADKRVEHPGLAVARNAHAMSLLTFDMVLAAGGVPKRIPGMRSRDFNKDAPPIPGGNGSSHGSAPSQKTVSLGSKVGVTKDGQEIHAFASKNGGKPDLFVRESNGTLTPIRPGQASNKVEPNQTPPETPVALLTGSKNKGSDKGKLTPTEEKIVAQYKNNSQNLSLSGKSTSNILEEAKAARISELIKQPDVRKREDSIAKDKEFAARLEENQGLHSNTQKLENDLSLVQVSPKRYSEVIKGDSVTGERIPLSFTSRAQYEEFKSEFAAVISQLRVDGNPVTARGQIIGTSTTFYSNNPDKPLGHHFDRSYVIKGGEKSDVDVDLNSPELLNHMLALPNPGVNDKVMIGGQRTIFKSGEANGLYRQFPTLRTFAEKWTKNLGGREVDIKLKIDGTTVKELNKPTVGPIEFFRKENR